MSIARRLSLLSVVAMFLACPGDEPDAAEQPARSATMSDAFLVPGVCDAPGEIKLGECSAAEIDAYLDCYASQCDDTYRSCFGPEYRDGRFDGPCAPLVRCVQDCGCAETACATRCGSSRECGACVQQRPCGIDCLPSCAAPVTRTCADLRACCERAKDATSERVCLTAVETAAVLGTTQANKVCDEAYETYQMLFCK